MHYQKSKISWATARGTHTLIVPDVSASAGVDWAKENGYTTPQPRVAVRFSADSVRHPHHLHFQATVEEWEAFANDLLKSVARSREMAAQMAEEIKGRAV